MSGPYPPLDSYKWIFVGGKGGVGKTTTSCAIALELSNRGFKTLLVSTDPASNIGDAFRQHFSSTPSLVKGKNNLFAMELPQRENGNTGLMKVMANLPGIDEVNALDALFGVTEHDDYQKIVFDTAPTGHTMKFLQLPKTVQNIFSSDFMGGIARMISGFGDTSQIDRMSNLLKMASERLKNPGETTFICVMIPEFLPLEETERLYQFLLEESVECHSFVVNQVIPKEKVNGCEFCLRRIVNQEKILRTIHEMYSDENIVVQIPLFEDELKEIDGLTVYGQYLRDLFVPI